MDIESAIVLGLVEGVTEFLPISSTFHLIFVSKFLHLPQSDFLKLFEVFIQSGAILSVLILYFRELIKDFDLLKKVIVSFIPTALIGFLMYKVIKNIFFQADALMLSVFFLVGIVFIGYEWYIQKKHVKLTKTSDKLSYKQAILIGIIQAFAIVPGVSRSGAVILGMMFLGYKRDESAKYSFILAVPTIFAASAYDLFKMRSVLSSQSDNMMILAIGFVTAFVSSYIVIKWLIGYLKGHPLSLFGWYRIVLVIIVLLITVIGG